MSHCDWFTWHEGTWSGVPAGEVVREVSEVVGEIAEVVRELVEVVGEIAEVIGELVEVVGELTDVVGEIAEVVGQLQLAGHGERRHGFVSMPRQGCSGSESPVGGVCELHGAPSGSGHGGGGKAEAVALR